MREVKEFSRKHPWLNDRAIEAIRYKHSREGYDDYRKAVESCNRIISEEYLFFVQLTRSKLEKVKSSSTKFWKITKNLLHERTAKESIPALKRADGS